MIFDAPWPKTLTPLGQWVLALWAAANGTFVILAVAAWLMW